MKRRRRTRYPPIMLTMSSCPGGSAVGRGDAQPHLAFVGRTLRCAFRGHRVGAGCTRRRGRPRRRCGSGSGARRRRPSRVVRQIPRPRLTAGRPGKTLPHPIPGNAWRRRPRSGGRIGPARESSAGSAGRAPGPFRRCRGLLLIGTGRAGSRHAGRPLNPQLHPAARPVHLPVTPRHRVRCRTRRPCLRHVPDGSLQIVTLCGDFGRTSDRPTSSPARRSGGGRPRRFRRPGRGHRRSEVPTIRRASPSSSAHQGTLASSGIGAKARRPASFGWNVEPKGISSVSRGGPESSHDDRFEPIARMGYR